MKKIILLLPILLVLNFSIYNLSANAASINLKYYAISSESSSQQTESKIRNLSYDQIKKLVIITDYLKSHLEVRRMTMLNRHNYDMLCKVLSDMDHTIVAVNEHRIYSKDELEKIDSAEKYAVDYR